VSTSRARSLALAAVGAAGDDAPALLARVAGPDAEAARAEATHLLALSPEALAAETARLRAPRPPGLDHVHPDWRGAVSETRTAAARVWAERLAFGQLVPMPTRHVEQVVSPADLPHARADWLIARLDRVGLRQVAHATAAAPKPELAALAARLAQRGKPFIEAVARILELGDGAAAVLGPRRAAQTRCAGIAVGTDRMAFLAIGARAIAPHLTDDLPWQLAQRLPRAPGERILTELLAWSHHPAAEAPPWTELTRA
jgi:hypothetical protein